MENIRAFLKRKDVIISAHRYGIDAMGAMAQGLFASLLIGTIIKTLGQQTGIAFLVTAGGYAAAEIGKLVSKETKVDILVTPAVTILVGVGLSALCAPAIGAAASAVGSVIMWATELQPLLMAFSSRSSSAWR